MRVAAKKKTTTKKTPKKSRSKAQKTPKRSWQRRLLSSLLLSFLVLALVGAGIVAFAFWYYSHSLPGIFSYDDYQPRQMTIVYDKDGQAIMELYDERRRVIAFEDMPVHMRNAIMAAEDASFMTHKGLDYVGVLRAIVVNIKRGGFSQGSSTITQQVVKNLLLTPEKQISRKIQEVLLARQIEDALSKDEILTIYLNHIYLGHRNYGIQQAAKFYFGKDAKDLKLVEAATLAGIVQSPERLSPRKHPDRALARRAYVLKQMKDKGFISEAEYREADKSKLTLAKEEESKLGLAPYFAETVRQMLVETYGRDFVYNSGLDVVTSLDLMAQKQAEEAFIKGMQELDARRYLNRPLAKPSKKAIVKFEKNKNYEAKIDSVKAGTVFFEIGDKILPFKPTSRHCRELPVDEIFKAGDTWFVQVTAFDGIGKPKEITIPSGANGALIAIDTKTREVRALVGGYNYKESVFNRALQAKRQSGSSFKTFVYGAALEAQIISPATIIDDAPKVFHIPGRKQAWSPQNADNKFKGPMTTRAALAQSRNTIVVDILERTGIARTIDFVRKFGITSTIDENFTLALGSASLNPLEVTNAYASIADGGIYKSPIFIKKITQNGKTLERPEQTQSQATSPEVAYVLTSMLKSVTTEGTAKSRLGKWTRDVAGKTGTTNDTKDTWFVGFTPQMACGVYVGHDEPKSLGRGEGGGVTALPIFADFMAAYHKNLPEEHFVRPDSVIEMLIDPLTGLLPNNPSAAKLEVFVPNTQPTQVAPLPEQESQENWMMRQVDLPSETDDIPDDLASEDAF